MTPVNIKNIFRALTEKIKPKDRSDWDPCCIYGLLTNEDSDFGKHAYSALS